MTVWITDFVAGTDLPLVHRYEAERVDENSATVLVRSGRRVIRQAQGRCFFTDEDAVRHYIEDAHEHSLSTHRSRIRDLENMARDGDLMAQVVRVIPNDHPPGRQKKP